MKTKNKLILIIVCVVIIILVFVANILRLMKQDSDGDTDINLMEKNIMSHSEAYRLLSYLEYDRQSRDSLPMDIAYADHEMSGWYDTYVNAVYQMDLIEKDISVNPRAALTYGECKGLTDRLIINNPTYQNIYAGLSFDFLKSEKRMSTQDFLELYEAILNETLEEDNIIKDEFLFILGNNVTSDSRDRLLTDDGLYYYLDAVDYGELPASKVSDNRDEYYDKAIKVLSCGDEIIYIYNISTEKVVLKNVWINLGEGNNVETFIEGMEKNFQSKARLSTEIQEVIGDITIEDSKVIQISIKPDTIKGKVLQTGNDFVEVENYGQLPLDENFKIYKIYGELTMEPSSSILVGYENTTFVVSEGKISAALIEESIKAENIRVLLNTTGYNGYYHDKVKFTSDTDFKITIKEEEKTYTAGEIIEVSPEDELISKGRIIIEPISESGRVEILSIERSNANPRYRGRVEISVDDKGLLVINELSLEEYLYAVVPSEMPTYYGLEPLKVQAVCARSYAYRHLMANSLSGYGAHVDDSVSYQVYNNIPENEESILAVKDTYGNVLEYDGETIAAYYFSTSCGHTTGAEYVWSGGQEIPFLGGRLLVPKEDSEDAMSQPGDEKYNDLSKEENFRDFILDTDYVTYDSEFNWYRWNVTIDTSNIKETLDRQLSSRYEANPNLIQTLVSGTPGEGDEVFESEPLESIGDVIDISVLKRGTGGIITELLIEGTERTIKVMTEYNIRLFMSPGDAILYRNDESEVNNLSLLPSAFFVIDKMIDDDVLKTVTLTGGGYGHGVGMSQNGAKGMADSGKEYDEIIKYFYQGTEIGFIYD